MSAVMRAVATHRLILNAVIFSGMHCELVEHKYVRFTVVLDSGLKTYLAKVSIGVDLLNLTLADPNSLLHSLDKRKWLKNSIML